MCVGRGPEVYEYSVNPPKFNVYNGKTYTANQRAGLNYFFALMNVSFQESYNTLLYITKRSNP
jgi:hypothetical protein